MFPIKSMMGVMAVVSTLYLLSCFDCPPSPLTLPSDSIVSGEQIQLTARLDGKTIGGEGCRGFWYVNNVLGGSDETGRVDSCGQYTAPDSVIESMTVTILGSPYLVGFDPVDKEKEFCEDEECTVCMDCCPSASARLFIRPE